MHNLKVILQASAIILLSYPLELTFNIGSLCSIHAASIRDIHVNS